MIIWLQVTEHAAPAHDPPRSTTSAAPAAPEVNCNPDPCEDAAHDARQTLNLADETLNLADDSAREAVAAARTAEDAALEAEAAADMAADDAVTTAERVAEEVHPNRTLCLGSALCKFLTLRKAAADMAAVDAVTMAERVAEEVYPKPEL